jgi:anti-sigma regulatory factor (Ser/Thr protein kinase)
MGKHKKTMTFQIIVDEKKESTIIPFAKDITFGNFDSTAFDKLLSFFDWTLTNKVLTFDFNTVKYYENYSIGLILLFEEFLLKKKCLVFNRFSKIESEVFGGLAKKANWLNLHSQISENSKGANPNIIIKDSKDREKALEFGKKYAENLEIEYEKSLRYLLNELLYNTLEHGKNEHNIPSLLQFHWDDNNKEISFIVADLGTGIRKHLRQTYPNLANDSEAILHALKPRISGTFARPKTGYETKNNAGVGLYFSSNIVQRLKGDMFIVSGNGFVHISPTEIVANELDNQWKGTFVYVKIKIGEIEDLNLQKMISEIREAIPKQNKITEDNSFYFNVSNYFGKYAEDKDKAKKIRDEKLLPAIAENKTLTIDFEDIISAPHSLLNAMLATPIERLGLAAYKKIKIINASPDIRETLDFIFEDNTPND